MKSIKKKILMKNNNKVLGDFYLVVEDTRGGFVSMERESEVDDQ